MNKNFETRIHIKGTEHRWDNQNMANNINTGRKQMQETKMIYLSRNTKTKFEDLSEFPASCFDTCLLDSMNNFRHENFKYDTQIKAYFDIDHEDKTQQLDEYTFYRILQEYVRKIFVYPECYIFMRTTGVTKDKKLTNYKKYSAHIHINNYGFSSRSHMNKWLIHKNHIVVNEDFGIKLDMQVYSNQGRLRMPYANKETSDIDNKLRYVSDAFNGNVVYMEDVEDFAIAHGAHKLLASYVEEGTECLDIPQEDAIAAANGDIKSHSYTIVGKNPYFIEFELVEKVIMQLGLRCPVYATETEHWRKIMFYLAQKYNHSEDKEQYVKLMQNFSKCTQKDNYDANGYKSFINAKNNRMEDWFLVKLVDNLSDERRCFDPDLVTTIRTFKKSMPLDDDICYYDKIGVLKDMKPNIPTIKQWLTRVFKVMDKPDYTTYFCRNKENGEEKYTIVQYETKSSCTPLQGKAKTFFIEIGDMKKSYHDILLEMLADESYRSEHLIDRVEFIPTLYPTEIKNVFNTFKGYPFSVQKTDYDHVKDKYSVYFNRFLRDVIADEKFSDYILVWCAHMLQFPGVRKAPLLRIFSNKGNTGKSAILSLICKLIAKENTSALGGSFDGILCKFSGAFRENMLLAYSDEFSREDNKTDLEALKQLIEDGQGVMSIEKKGKDPYNAKNYLRFIVTSNHLQGLNLQHRRVCVVEPMKYYGKDTNRDPVVVQEHEEFFDEFKYHMRNKDSLQAFFDYLATMPITEESARKFPEHHQLKVSNEMAHVNSTTRYLSELAHVISVTLRDNDLPIDSEIIIATKELYNSNVRGITIHVGGQHIHLNSILPYSRFCFEENMKAINSTSFGSALLKEYNIVSKRPRVDGKQLTSYVIQLEPLITVLNDITTSHDRYNYIIDEYYQSKTPILAPMYSDE